MASVQYKKSKSGKRTYYVVVSFSGKHKWLKAGTLSDARALKRQLESMEKTRRIEKLGLASKMIRIDDFLQKYMDHVKLHTTPNTLKRYRSVLNTFVHFLKLFHPGLKHVSQINVDHIESFQRERIRSKTLQKATEESHPNARKNMKLPLPQTVNFEVTVLRSAFLWGKEREWVTVAPTKGIKRLRHEPNRKRRILSPQECRLLLKTAKMLSKDDSSIKIFHLAFQFLLNTGLRASELCYLTWDDLNLKTEMINIQAKDRWSPKTYERKFFLNETCMKVLRKLKTGPGFVFKDERGRQLTNDRLRKALIKVARQASLDITRIHDMRHTFNSLMQMNGVDPGTMARILGHKDIETTMIYTHQTTDHLKSSISRLKLN